MATIKIKGAHLLRDAIEAQLPKFRKAIEAALDKERRLKDMICPQCWKPFELKWENYDSKPQTLQISSCPSGGIYAIEIRCPHCNYEEPL